MFLPCPTKFQVTIGPGDPGFPQLRRSMACAKIIHVQFHPKVSAEVQVAMDWSRAILRDLISHIDSPAFRSEVAGTADRRGMAALVQRVQDKIFTTHGLSAD